MSSSDTSKPEAEVKSNPFDKEMKSFLRQCNTVLETKNSLRSKLKSSKPNPILRNLLNYEKAYKASCSEDLVDVIYDDWLILYKKHRASILSGHHDDEWIREGAIDIQYGASLPGEKKNTIRVMLSSIYKDARQMKEATIKRLEGLPKSAYDKCNELNYPESILLHWYRIMRILVTQHKDKMGKINVKSDIQKLNLIITDIESDLGIASGDEAPTSSIGGLIGMATQFATKMGVEIPKELPSESQIESAMTGVLGKIMDNPTTQATMKGLINKLPDGKDPVQNPMDMIQTLLNGLKDSKLDEAIATTLGTKESVPASAITPAEEKKQSLVIIE